MHDKWTIAHFSDLHLATSSFQDTAQVHVSEAFRRKVLKNFETIIDNDWLRNEIEVDAVVVSGDITSQGDSGGLAYFSDRIISPLMRLLRKGLDGRAVCVVPGNHDVLWNLDPYDREYFDKKFKFFRSHVADGCGATGVLLPRGNATELYFSENHSPMYISPDNDLVVLCINSALRCGERDEETRKDVLELTNELRDGANVDLETLANKLSLRDIAHITPEQRIYLEKSLSNAKKELGSHWPSALKVATLHHHLVPFVLQKEEHKPFESVLDAGAILSMLGQFEFDLILTGHKH